MALTRSRMTNIEPCCMRVLDAIYPYAMLIKHDLQRNEYWAGSCVFRGGVVERCVRDGLLKQVVLRNTDKEALELTAAGFTVVKARLQREREANAQKENG